MSSPVLPPGALLDPQVVRLQRRRRARLFLVGGLLVVLAAVAAPVYRAGKHWRARQLVAEAEKLTAERKIPAAATKAQAAFELAPGEAGSLRAVARVYSLAGSGLAIGFWKSLLERPEATAADRREAARFALRVDQMDFADDQIQALLRESPVDVEALELATQDALQKGDRESALDSLGRLLKLNPESEGTRLLQAQILAGSTDAAERSKGRRVLMGIAKGENANALSALLRMAQLDPLAPEDARVVADALSVHPLSRTAEKLTAILLRIRLEPLRRAELIQQAVAQFGLSGPDDLVDLSRWLLRLGEFGRVVQLIGPEAALARQDLFLVRLDAMASLGLWFEIQQTLEKGKPPIEPVYVQVFLARAAKQLGEDEDANAHWNIALASAGSNAQQTIYLARYAQKMGERRISEKAWRQLARLPAWMQRANLALLPLLQAAGDTRTLREAVQQLLRLNPQDPATQNDAAYLDLLLEEHQSEATATAEKLFQAHPEVLAYRTTRALAYLRSGQAEEARQLYASLEGSWESAPPRSQAIHAAAAGSTTGVAPATLATLLPEERALLEQIPTSRRE